MTRRRVRLEVDDANLREGFSRIRREHDVPSAFPDDAEAAASSAVDRLDLSGHVDRTDIAFVTIDPPGSRDLDQALHVEPAANGGSRVRYAIADVGAFVRVGDPVDLEARRRGVTTYLPDGSAPLHPRVLSEDAASLVAGHDRPAVLHTIVLDATGVVRDATVERAVVRSREQLSYEEAQRRIDVAGDPMLTMLLQVGRVRQEREWLRGGISLPLADQEFRRTPLGYTLEYRRSLPVEEASAQVSLLTGIVASRRMLAGGVGILRTLPPPTDEVLAVLRERAHALAVAWPEGITYASWLRSMSAEDPRHQALVTAATSTLRGAGWVAFDGAPPAQPLHGAIASTYAHVTAPLRRLVDRYANEVLLALAAGRSPDAEVRAALSDVAKDMSDGSRRANGAARAALDLGESLVLLARRGEVLVGVVVDDRGKRPQVQLADPAVVAPLDVARGDVGAGQRVRVKVTAAGDRVRLELAE